MHLLLERAQLVAAEFGEQDRFGSGWDVALDVQDRLDGADFVAAAVDEAGDARVGRDADRSRCRLHAKKRPRGVSVGLTLLLGISDSERERGERERSLEEGREGMATEGRGGEKGGFGELFVRRGHLKLADAVDCEWGSESERVCAARERDLGSAGLTV